MFCLTFTKVSNILSFWLIHFCTFFKTILFKTFVLKLITLLTNVFVYFLIKYKKGFIPVFLLVHTSIKSLGNLEYSLWSLRVKYLLIFIIILEFWGCLYQKSEQHMNTNFSCKEWYIYKKMVKLIFSAAVHVG